MTQCEKNTEVKKPINCVCKVKIDGKMSLVSLYDDLPHFELDQTIDNVSAIWIQINCHINSDWQDIVGQLILIIILIIRVSFNSFFVTLPSVI